MKVCVKVAVIMICICLVFSFSSCRGRAAPKIDADGNITLQFWSIYPVGDPNNPWMMGNIRRFMDQNPTVTIEHTGISFWDYFTKINTAQTDPNGPDIFFHTITDNNARAMGGVSMDISGFFREGVLTPYDFSEMDRAALTFRGGIFGVPYATDGRVLYYNIDIVNELLNTTDEQWRNTRVGRKQGTTIFGRPDDLLNENGNVRAPRTFDELAAYSELLTVRAPNGNITRLGFDLGIGNNSIMNLVWTHGGSFFDENQNPIVDTNPGVRKGFEVWHELARVHPIRDINAFVGGTAGVADTVNLFFQGAVALMIATNEVPWQNARLTPENRVNMGAAPIPFIGNYRYNFSGGFSLEISNRLVREDPRVAQAAFDFVEFMMSEEIQREVLFVTNNMPGRVSIYEELIREIDDPVKRIVIEEMNFRRPFDFVPGIPQWWGPVFEHLTRFVSGRSDLDRALSDAQRGIERIRRTN